MKLASIDKTPEAQFFFSCLSLQGKVVNGRLLPALQAYAGKFNFSHTSS